MELCDTVKNCNAVLGGQHKLKQHRLQAYNHILYTRLSCDIVFSRRATMYWHVREKYKGCIQQRNRSVSRRPYIESQG